MLTLLCFGPNLHAQNTVGLIELAKRENHTSRERERVATWVRTQVEMLQSNSGNAATKVFRETFAQFSSNSAIPVTNGFRNLLGEQCSKTFAASLAEIDDEKALAVALVLARIPAATTVDGLAACLGHANQGVQYWGAEGLRRRRPQLVPSTANARRALRVLQDAAARVENPIVLRQIYAALDYTEPTAPAAAALTREMVDTVNKVVDVRLAAYRNQSARAVAGDVRMAHLLANLWLYERTPADAKKETLGKLGRLLQTASGLYGAVDPSAPIRKDLPTVVLACEVELARIVKRSKPDRQGDLPSVFAQIRDNATPQLVQLVVWQWIGTQDVDGVLNQAPFDLPAPPPITFDGNQ